MAQAPKKRPSVTSPKGTFRFPKLTEPDYGSDKFPKPDGEYNVQLVLHADSDEFKKFMAVLTPHYEAAMEKAEADFKELPVGSRKKLGKITQNDLYTTLYDKETEEPTGEVVFKATMRASGVRKKGPKAGTKWTMKPAIFDAKGNYLAKPPAIWGGSVGRINVELNPYFIPATGAAGLKLALVGAQVIELVSAGQKDAKSLGFGAEEDGYGYSPEDNTPSMPAESSAEGDDNAEGDF